ncbi:hypothetical protein GCM10023329_01460 [Streptomyces sanyensis]|uniref:Uncharacterized protein n=1 Tax=Streptomyces sanyensis TaxID=568869 RepID=A0ABP8ZN81_9ACTN
MVRGLRGRPVTVLVALPAFRHGALGERVARAPGAGPGDAVGCVVEVTVRVAEHVTALVHARLPSGR